MIYLHAGSDRMILKKNIIGIFDLDNCSTSQRTREFLKKTEKKKKMIAINEELPVSFLVDIQGKVFLSPISSASLKKRWESKNSMNE